jgi:hypothetical protein
MVKKVNDPAAGSVGPEEGALGDGSGGLSLVQLPRATLNTRTQAAPTTRRRERGGQEIAARISTNPP